AAHGGQPLGLRDARAHVLRLGLVRREVAAARRALALRVTDDARRAVRTLDEGHATRIRAVRGVTSTFRSARNRVLHRLVMHLAVLPNEQQKVPTPALKPPAPAEALAHRDLMSGEFWRRIPAYKDVSEQQFLDHHWQAKNSILKPEKLL